MSSKAFRIDWYPHASFVDFAKLKACEIGVFMQIINLIYIKNGPIENDARYIGKNCGLGRAKCERIINELITKEILLVSGNKISQKRCIEELDAVQNRRNNSKKNGKKGAESRWGIEQNQLDKNGEAMCSDIASTSTHTRTNHNTLTPPEGDGVCLARYENFDIEKYLDDEGLAKARASAPRWDIYELMRKYNKRIQEGKHPPPDLPNKAFPAWCYKVTEGRPPP